MVLRKLRLQRGWSQEHVAELTDLSVRTIQRIERGGKPSLESAQALAAVFEVDLTTFLPTTGATLMSDQQQLKATSTEQNKESQAVTTEEKVAINYVKGIKEFYGHLFMYSVFMLAFLITGKFSYSQALWLSLGWGAGVVMHGIVAFEIFGSYGTNWEKKQIEKKLGRKL
ncbi:hypothetical protein MNBD_GAMMA02-50 [hydrothermal vent metagenome]|uniref:HTH cro/C1-type domain-containing protein n=1 Tax=hydrothermal vent metagenome TaxID=652676 RepID=A0A3B0VZN4_9ZZZZ